MCPSKSKWCSRFFCVFRGPVSVKKGTIRKTYFITSPTLPPFSQSWCEDFWQSQAEWKKVPSLQYWMCQFRESTLTEWGKGSGSYEICFSDGTFFSQIPEQKKLLTISVKHTQEYDCQIDVFQKNWIIKNDSRRNLWESAFSWHCVSGAWKLLSL